MTLQKAR